MFLSQLPDTYILSPATVPGQLLHRGVSAYSQRSHRSFSSSTVLGPFHLRPPQGLFTELELPAHPGLGWTERRLGEREGHMTL